MMLSSTPPKVADGLSRRFAADPFDARLHNADAERSHTPLGLIAEALWGFYNDSVHPDYVRSFEACLRREAPDVLADLQRLRDER
jgi:hypothetical protein